MRLGLALALAAGLALIASASVAAPDLRAALEAFVREHAPEPPSAIEIPALDDFAVSSPPGEAVELRLSAHPDARFLGRVPVSVVLLAQGQTLKRGVVTVRVRLEREVLVVARALRRGEPVSAATLRREKRDLAELPAGVLTGAEDLSGLRTRRSLRAGEVLSHGVLEAAPLVVRGESVRVELERGGLRIETRGEAREDGDRGDVVRVLTRDARRELSGRVVGEGVVRVAF